MKVGAGVEDFRRHLAGDEERPRPDDHARNLQFEKRVLRDRKPGSMHALIFFGFLALFIGTDIIAVEEDFTVPLIGPDAGRILVGGFYQSYEFILDTMGLVLLAGLIWLVSQR